MNNIFYSLHKLITETIDNKMLSSKIQKFRLQQEIQENNRRRTEGIIYNCMANISFNMYEALHNSSYSNINQLHSPSDIRIENYTVTPQGDLLYHFSLPKTCVTTINSTALQCIRKRMNIDIARSRHILVQQYGDNFVAVNYPFIFHGLSVASIKDVGFDVMVTVVTPLKP